MEPRKAQLLLIMIASVVSGGLAILLALFIGSREFMTVSIPGFVVGAFFAFKYFMYDKTKAKQEEHKKRRRH